MLLHKYIRLSPEKILTRLLIVLPIEICLKNVVIQTHSCKEF